MIQIMKIGTDKWKHFGINYAICALLGDYGVPFAPVSYTHLDVYKRQVFRCVKHDRLEQTVGPG